MISERPDALVVTGDPLMQVNRDRIADLAAKNGVPSMSSERDWVAAGFLASYGTTVADLWRRAAAYVDKILKGAKPADLPVEQPTKFDFIINLRTAQALG